MTEYEKKLQELKPIMALTDSESMNKKEMLLQWLEAHSDNDENQKILNAFIEKGLAEEKEDILAIRRQIESVYDLVPISYIAKHYFGKSRAWLYQRVNGNKVRGKVYSLNDQQKETFNNALQDIAKQIGSIRLT